MIDRVRNIVAPASGSVSSSIDLFALLAQLHCASGRTAASPEASIEIMANIYPLGTGCFSLPTPIKHRLAGLNNVFHSWSARGFGKLADPPVVIMEF